MSHVEFKQILNSIDLLTPEQMQRLRRELDGKIGALADVSPATEDPFLGSMSDHAELMDRIVEDAMLQREQPWRLSSGE